MKILSLILCLSMSLNIFASEGIEDVIDSYSYSMTVEWDQKDAEFKQAKTTELLERLLYLQNDGGFSHHDILLALGKRINDPNAVEVLKLRAIGLDGAQGPLHLLKILETDQELFYSRGASWNGTAIAFYGGIAVIFIALASYSLWFDANYECTEWVPSGRHNTCANWEKKN